MHDHFGQYGHLEIKSDGNNPPIAGELKAAIEGLTTTMSEYRRKNDERYDQLKRGQEDVVTKAEITRIEGAIEMQKTELKGLLAELERKQNHILLNAPAPGGKKAASPERVEYDKKFEDWFRKGDVSEYELKDLATKAAVAVTDNAGAGGFTVSSEMESSIDSVLKEVSPIRSIASVRTISKASYEKLVNQHGVNSGWVGERDPRPQTLAADLAKLEIVPGEIYAMPSASQSMLEDSGLDIAQWLSEEVDLEFAAQEGKAFVSGDGVKKPRGFIGGYNAVPNANWAWGSLGYVATGAVGAFAASTPADALLDLIFSLKKGYRDGSQFVKNRKTMAAVRKLKDGQGNYLADLRLRDGALVETVFGFSVTEAEDMPDIGANALAISFGNFKRGYLVVDRRGITVLRDPYTAKPYVLFYTTKRVGGGVVNFECIKHLKFATS